MAASAEALRYSAASAMVRAASNVTYSPSRPEPDLGSLSFGSRNRIIDTVDTDLKHTVQNV